MTIEEVKKIDSELQIAKYINKDSEEANRLWDMIKNDKETLELAITVVRDKFNENDITLGIAICDAMLIDYKTVDKDVYQKLVNTIYTNTDIARLVLDGAANGGYSYLLMTLWNFDLILTPEQKLFAIDEAMNKPGTTKQYQQREAYKESLIAQGANDEETSKIDIDGLVTPIGQLSGAMFMHDIFSRLDSTQAHGCGTHDIRYYVLRNPNFSVEEKKVLVYDFYRLAEVWDDLLDRLMWGIINDDVNFKDGSMSEMELDMFYDYDIDSLTELYGNKETAEIVLAEINFCKLMRELRPPQWLCEDEVSEDLEEEINVHGGQSLSLKNNF